MFREKSMVCAENNFSPFDLLNFVESLLRTSKLYERRYNRSNYSWLSSRTVGSSSDCELDEFKPMMQKLTPENCAAIAVKLQLHADDLKSTSSILAAFRSLLKEQYSMQMMERNVKREGERSIRKRKQNKVRPVLMPPGRQPTVSFILN